MSPSWSHIWGKSADSEAGLRFHPLACHLLDVAAVAERLLAGSLPVAALAKDIGTTPERLSRFLILCCALHDIGKCSAPFQALVPALWPGLADPVFGDCPSTLADPLTHGEITGIYLRVGKGDLRAILAQAAAPMPDDCLGGMVIAIAGHHGQPIQEDPARLAQFRPRSSFTAAATALMTELIRIIGADGLGPDLAISTERAAALSWLLSALLPVSDWVASNQLWFPPHGPVQDLDRYWSAVARPRAEEAVRQAGLVPAPIARPEPARTLRHLAGAVLSPVQAYAFGCDLGRSGPALFLIEDATGAGKTEAALALAHRLMAEGRATGFYFGLPTMATANAMHGRLETSYRALFADGAVPSLALAHGKALRNTAFLASIKEVSGRNSSGEEDGGAFCSGWIADSRRKALLAQAGAGTLDQALMAVLPLRYQSLRLQGLIGKVLILDEVHSFDPYMLRLIETLLELHAMLGGSAILMSATLPVATRQRLVNAFAAGLRIAPPAISAQAYPLVTALTDGTVHETPLPLAPRAERRVRVERLGSVAEAEQLALAMAAKGAAVALLRSTVDAALASHQRIMAVHPDTTLFHARFLLDDRLAIERQVLARFGKSDDPARPRAGHILVATQVIEQSLDLDFDVLITDLAPVDLLIQRAGRLWRHHRTDRPAAVTVPVLHVISPEPGMADGQDWLEADLPEAKQVYEDTALLWLSARRLFEAGAIETATLTEGTANPAHLRRLVEAVYAADPDALPTDSLRAIWNRMDGKAVAERQGAEVVRLKPCEGYLRTGPWDSEARASTRLELQPRVTLRLARRDGAALRPLGADWSLSELRLTPKQAKGLTAPTPAEAAQLAPHWAEADQGVRLLVLTSDGAGGWRSADGCHHYDSAFGLRIGPDSETG